MLNEKIKEILSLKNLSPSRFADEIGVQRSSISHILSGRNKPSLDIIQKINRRFPDLGTHWFMEDTPATEGKKPVPPPVMNQANEPARSTKTPGTGVLSNAVAALHEGGTGKEIEKILIFYKDRTFSEYRPSQ